MNRTNNMMVAATLMAGLLCSSLAHAGDATNRPSAASLRWPADKACAWYNQQPWLVGCNFLPNTAVNDVEMWQAESFDAATIERELGWAHDLGFNTVRVFLNYVVWEADANGLKKRFDQFLAIAEKNDIRVMPVLLDDCNFADHPAAIGKQPEPVPGVCNSQWVSSPPRKMVDDHAAWPQLERYVKDMVGAFANDRRVVIWDLYNEPGNSGVGENSRPLLEAAFAWAREMKPTQPLTVGAWINFSAPPSQRMMELSDIISYHGYDDRTGIEAKLKICGGYARPVLCTEWLLRQGGNNFETMLPLFRDRKIGCYNWGLVAGRTQTYLQAGSKNPEPVVWQHDIFHKDGSPFKASEVEIIKATTGQLPDVFNLKLSDIHIRDPFILADQTTKTYYLYAQSGNRQNDKDGFGVEVYSSKDLVNWSAPVLVFERPKSGFWGGPQIWAPEVHQFGKSYFMFVTFTGRAGGLGTQILQADRPQGPFQILGDTANTPPEQRCLDGTPWIDEDETYWLIYCNEWTQVKDGTMRAVRMTDDWTARKGDSILLFRASAAPWVRAYSPGNYVTDGPFLYRIKGGKLIMIWSSFRKGGDYAVGVAESESGSVKGPWRHAPEVLFGKDGGHGMIFRNFAGDLFLCLHQPNGGNLERAHFFKLKEDDGRLTLDARLNMGKSPSKQEP